MSIKKQIIIGCIGASVMFLAWLQWTSYTMSPPPPKVPMESVSVTIWYDRTGEMYLRQEAKVVHRPEIHGIWDRPKAGEQEE